MARPRPSKSPKLLRMIDEIRRPRLFPFSVLPGDSVNGMTRLGITPLLVAVRWQDSFVVQTLLENGADPNHPVPGWPSPLEVASCLIEPEIFEMLREAGAQPKPAETLNAERAKTGSLPFSLWTPPEALPLYHASLERDEETVRSLVVEYADDADFATRLYKHEFKSFPKQPILQEMDRQVIVAWCERLLIEACQEGECEFAAGLLAVLDELGGEVDCEAMENAARYGRDQLARQLAAAGSSIEEMGREAFTAAIKNGHYELARWALAGGTIKFWSRFVASKTPFQWNEPRVVVEQLLEVLEETGRAQGIEILAPHTSPERAEKARKKLARWQKQHNLDEAPPKSDPLQDAPDWKNGRPDVMQSTKRRRKKSKAPRKKLEDNTPLPDNPLEMFKRGKKNWEKKQAKRETEVRKRRRKSKGGILTFDYNNGVLFVRGGVAEVSECLTSLPDFGTRRIGVHENAPKRFPRECALALQIRDHPWTTVLLPVSFQSFPRLEQLAEETSRGIRNQAVAYAVGDTAGVLQYAFYEQGRLKERLSLGEGDFAYRCSSRNFKKADVEKRPYDRTEDLFLELDLWESGAVYDDVKNTLKQHARWPDSGQPGKWWEPMEGIDLVRIR